LGRNASSMNDVKLVVSSAAFAAISSSLKDNYSTEAFEKHATEFMDIGIGLLLQWYRHRAFLAMIFNGRCLTDECVSPPPWAPKSAPRQPLYARTRLSI
jgi:hypothetical protein